VATDPRLAARRSARPASEQVERHSDQPYDTFGAQCPGGQNSTDGRKRSKVLILGAQASAAIREYQQLYENLWAGWGRGLGARTSPARPTRPPPTPPPYQRSYVNGRNTQHQTISAECGALSRGRGPPSARACRTRVGAPTRGTRLRRPPFPHTIGPLPPPTPTTVDGCRL
jgi:hypothetical protein